MVDVTEPTTQEMARARDEEATRAFEELRLDVMIVRRDLEKLSGLSTPDYSVTLGEIKKALGAVAQRLVTIEKHPALQMTPAVHEQLIADSGRTVMREAVGQLELARRGIEHTQQELAAIIGVAKDRADQRSSVLVTLGAGLVIGLVLSPFTVGLLPFGLDSRVAALIMRTDRWRAGAELMQVSNPEGWAAIEHAVTLWHLNRAPIQACQDGAAKTHKTQQCVITVRDAN